jgi:hypothetical protein
VLDDVEAVSYSRRAGFQGNLDVAILVISTIAGMVALPDPNVREIIENFIRDCIIALERAIGIFLLNKIEADGQPPVEIHHISQNLLIFIIFQSPQTEEDEPYAEPWIVLFDPIVDFIESACKSLPVMLLHELAFLVVLFQLGQKSSEFNPLVAVSDVFLEDVLGIAREDVFYDEN